MIALAELAGSGYSTSRPRPPRFPSLVSEIRRRVSIGYRDPNPRRAEHDSAVDRELNRLNGIVVDVLAPTTPDTEFVVTHPNLKKIVEEYFILAQDTAGILYRSSPSKWNHNVSMFKYSGAGGRLRLRLR